MNSDGRQFLTATICRVPICRALQSLTWLQQIAMLAGEPDTCPRPDTNVSLDMRGTRDGTWLSVVCVRAEAAGTWCLCTWWGCSTMAGKAAGRQNCEVLFFLFKSVY